MRITFLGAAREVTGSCSHVALSSGCEFLVDSGYFQGHEKDLARNSEELSVDWSKIEVVVLTHAHLDHCGRIPIFVKQGFRGKIITTAPTAEIAEVVWRDNLHILETARNLQSTEPFYSEKDIETCVASFDLVEYNEPYKLSDGTTLEFFDAGHIVGSASVKVRDGDNVTVFSGDLGNDILGIVDDPETPASADTVVMEATYGDRVHSATMGQQKMLKANINKILEKKSTLLIPAFAIERTQELLIDLNDLVESGKIPRIPVYLDSPMASKVTEITKKHRKYLSNHLKKEILEGDDPFTFSGLTTTDSAEESKKINFAPGPKVIIASSGMMTGGRVLHHLKRVLPDPRNVLLIVGYQVKGTLGREIQDKTPRVNIDGRSIYVRCEVDSTDVYSAHADMNQLIAWLDRFHPQPKNIILNHGDDQARDNLKSLITAKFKSAIYVPNYGEIVSV